MTKLLNCASEMNRLGKQATPFIFVIDFLAKNILVKQVNQISNDIILYNINGVSNYIPEDISFNKSVFFNAIPLDPLRYRKAFEKVMKHLQRGDSYLLNLTMPVALDTNLSLLEIFKNSKAQYKLWMKDRFTVFSPEPFIRIREGRIYTYPMKGTIDASLPEAEKQLLSNQKELAEHYTIVDLLRNDLSLVADHVRVDRFRYVEELLTTKGHLLQSSSTISGKLPSGFSSHIGDIITRLLPAGSVTGAPKKKTVEIILEVEKYDRGFYTGVFGFFDGVNLDSGVMIRFIEQTADGLVFKAGGGITVNSKPEDEYNELMQKVYLPF
jgi:para-aminobenzoate synthetase component 1